MKSGINVIGYVDGEFGLGEAVRLNLKAMDSVGLPYNAIDYKKIKKTKNKSQNSEFIYNVNLIQLSLNDMTTFLGGLDTSIFDNRYNVLFLVWESEFIPEEIQEKLYLFHEIWTPSMYCREIFKQYFLGPIITIPHPVEVVLEPIIENDFLKIYDAEKFSFLFIFNFGSSIVRKNTLFLIKAFKEAFNKDLAVELIIKCSNSKKFKEDLSLVLNEIGTHKNIKLLDVDLDKNDLNHFINQCDSYVSLHHSEGFGLTLAEAMCLGKPAIATNYSGNLEFMNDRNSFLVDYLINSIDNPDQNFCTKTVWADPLLEDSVAKLQLVFENKQLATEKANKARIDTQAYLSFKNVGKKIANRIEVIDNNFRYISNNQAELMKVSSRIVVLEMELKKIKKSSLIKFILKVKKFLRSIKSKYKK